MRLHVAFEDLSLHHVVSDPERLRKNEAAYSRVKQYNERVSNGLLARLDAVAQAEHAGALKSWLAPISDFTKHKLQTLQADRQPADLIFNEQQPGGRGVMQVTKQELKAGLDEGRQVTSKVIDALTVMLQAASDAYHRAASVSGGKPMDSLFMDSNLATRMSWCSPDGAEQPAYENVRRFTEWVKTNHNMHLMDFRAIYIPVNVDDAHWVAVVVDVVGKTVKLYDSLPAWTGSERSERILRSAVNWLCRDTKAHGGPAVTAAEWTTETPAAPIQGADRCVRVHVVVCARTKTQRI